MRTERIAVSDPRRGEVWWAEVAGDGMPEECAVSLDNLRVVPKGALNRRICTLGPARMAAASVALSDAVDC